MAICILEPQFQKLKIEKLKDHLRAAHDTCNTRDTKDQKVQGIELQVQ